jgi:hypothetical protein
MTTEITDRLRKVLGKGFPHDPLVREAIERIDVSNAAIRRAWDLITSTHAVLSMIRDEDKANQLLSPETRLLLDQAIDDPQALIDSIAAMR